VAVVIAMVVALVAMVDNGSCAMTVKVVVIMFAMVAKDVRVWWWWWEVGCVWV